MRILVVSPYFPHPHVGHGGGTAVRSLIQELARRHDVRVVSLLRPGERGLAAAAADLGVPIETVGFPDRTARGLERAALVAGRLQAIGRALVTGRPFYVAKYENAELARRTIACAESFAPDAVQVEYLQLAGLLRRLRRWRDERPAGAPRPRLILDSHEFASLPRRRRAAAAAWPQRAYWLAEAAAWDRTARQASTWADTTICVTEQDRALYQAVGGSAVVTVPLGVDTRRLRAERAPVDPPRVLFVGSFQHPPNRAAARLLCERIWPAVVAELPGWRLVLAGPGSDTFLAGMRPRPRGVAATGFVDDLAPLFRESRLFAAPLFAGGGIKIKILEAMARGIPVVTTPIGAEGITSGPDGLVWWAETPEAFVTALIAAAHAPAEAARRADRARDHVARHFSWESVVDRLERLYRGEPLPTG
ncbi:MAG TPA: glycosyltransferase family 4 protein [Candidatus Krumholzibacteria bacterium]|nr:glycosyltransferase family 4 protein [Candidatus Krumholzibacteria bacterium]HPD71196.1 glycosyltransferase family 4 protein [Candidatus Krumholzibacteria bacterium]HRY39104.1 glycosyltransferase family 4 protein [Candidatus Krumholzibacteria bacterium]